MLPNFDRVFWTFVHPAANGCWEWKGTRNRGGYGITYMGWDREADRSRQALAHRVAWELVHGPVPAGLHVLHHCDNPSCVRPEHLFVGTQADNTADMDRKGRRVNSPRPGEMNHFHRLTAAEVAQIRHRYSFRRTTYKALAAEYGVHPDTIRLAVTHQTWKGVPV